MNKLNFQELVNHHKLSKEGKDWLLCALDPFHDVNNIPVGYPDSNAGLSTTQLYTKTFQISAPPGAAANWDALIGNAGFSYGSSLNFRPTTSTDFNTKITYDHDNASISIYPIYANSSDTGQNLWWNWTAGGAHTNFTSTGVGNLQGYQSGRIIAQGIEIHNTTSSLYKQGTVVVGSVPRNADVGAVNFKDDNASPYDPQENVVNTISAPPLNQSNAALFPNSKTWPAERGAYLINTFCSVDNPVGRPIAKHLEYQWAGSENAINTVTAMAFGSDQNVVGTPFINDQLNLSYAYFTGLSNETTLQVTVKTYFEIFPSYYDTFVSVATPSPAYDVRALALYSALVQHLPPGVPVDMNPSGEYFQIVLDLLRKYAPAVLDLTSTAFPALRPITNVTKQLLRPNKPKKKSQDNIINAPRGSFLPKKSK
jgi:hypothetical protein